MWTTLVTTIKVNLREKSNVFWMFAFPIILATLFVGMFSGLGGDGITPQRMAIVEDSNWSHVQQAGMLVKTLSGKDKANADRGTQQTLITPHAVDSIQSAQALVRKQQADGYLYANENGTLGIAVSDTLAADATNAISASNASITITALHSVINQFNQSMASAKTLAGDAARGLGNPSSNGTAASRNSYTYTTDHSLTHFAPDPFARYYYALLGMACLMSMSFAIVSITLSQANLSPLGARRSIAPLSKWKQLSASFCASWLVSFISLLVAFLYIRFVCGISAGGREGMAIVAIAISSFVATSCGLLIGALPRLSQGAKIGISTAIACIGALFAGLYGQYAMDVNDAISRKVPALHMLNPVKQVSDLFYDLLYYDSYRPFLLTTGIIILMGALFMGSAVMLLRRQRYEYL